MRLFILTEVPVMKKVVLLYSQEDEPVTAALLRDGGHARIVDAQHTVGT